MQVGEDLLLRCARTWREDDRSACDLAQGRMLQGACCRVGDSGMSQKRFVDLDRRDLPATAIDHLLDPTDACETDLSCPASP